MKKELTLKLNEYLSDCAIEYVKLHNLHWNVVGGQFKAAHEFLENLYNEMALTFDEVAELLKMHNQMPFGRYSDYIEHTSIKEIDNINYDIHKALEIVLNDYKHLKELGEQIRNNADKDGLYDVVTIIEDKLISYNKTIWFIESMLK